jgi:hypothetical protein
MDINYTAIAAAQELVRNNQAVVLDSTGILAIIFAAFLIFFIGLVIVESYTKRDMLYSVWRNGIPHTQKEYPRLFERYKLKRRGINLD